jgi:hypothetical protein
VLIREEFHDFPYFYIPYSKFNMKFEEFSDKLAQLFFLGVLGFICLSSFFWSLLLKYDSRLPETCEAYSYNAIPALFWYTVSVFAMYPFLIGLNSYWEFRGDTARSRKFMRQLIMGVAFLFYIITWLLDLLFSIHTITPILKVPVSEFKKTMIWHFVMNDGIEIALLLVLNSRLKAKFERSVEKSNVSEL